MNQKEEIFKNKNKLHKLEKERLFWYRRFLFTKHYKTKIKLESIICEMGKLQLKQSELRNNNPNTKTNLN